MTALHQYEVVSVEYHTRARYVNVTCREPECENKVLLEMGMLRFYARPCFVTSDSKPGEQVVTLRYQPPHGHDLRSFMYNRK